MLGQTLLLLGARENVDVSLGNRKSGFAEVTNVSGMLHKVRVIFAASLMCSNWERGNKKQIFRDVEGIALVQRLHMLSMRKGE